MGIFCSHQQIDRYWCQKWPEKSALLRLVSNDPFNVASLATTAINHFMFQFRLLFRLSNLFVLLVCSCLFNKYVTQLKFQRTKFYDTHISHGICDVLDATHEASINLLLHTLTTFHRIFQYKKFLAAWRKPSHQLAQNDLASCFPSFTSCTSFRCVATLWLNKILCPIVTVSWCSFNFPLFLISF